MISVTLRLSLIQQPLEHQQSHQTQQFVKPYATKLTSVSGTFTADEKITQASTAAIGRVVEWDATNSFLYYQQERYTDYGTSSVGAYVAFSGANAITGASSSAAGTPDSSADSAVTLANGFTITFTDGYVIQNFNQTVGILFTTKTDHLSPVQQTRRKTLKL